jgi:glutaconyl-CoA/methylmalonyl-CoA decarboxylase subunit gamma
MDNHKVNVRVNGTNYLVEIGDLSAQLIQVQVNGRPYEVQVTAVEKSAPAISGYKPHEMSETGRHGAHSGSSSGLDSEVRAPMPGTILNISVKVGDAVKRGQQLCALEAMKMKSAIRSPRDGVIGIAEVSEGMKVAYRDLLFRFE